MIKKVFGGVVVIAIATIAAFNINMNNAQDNNLSELNLDSVEALAQEIGSGNTGPAQVEDCGGLMDARTKKLCMCTNTYSCTESSCS